MSAPSTPTPPTRSAAPAALSAGPPSTPSKLAAPPPPPAHSLAGHLRATALFIVLTLLVSAFGYPLFVTGIAQVIEPASANGSLLKDPNGTIIGSSLIAQNTSAPYLFWERPSPTDYNTTDGMVTPYGATDPALLNETLAYMAQYGNFTVNATLPFWLVSQSGSSIDPDLTPEAVLVQVPRVAHYGNVTQEWLTGFVNDHITEPPIPYLGVPYVDVLQLDIDLLPYIGR
ncbi:MAG: potassium-transporting ATPase subunit C [Thermoplasmata archaeon]